VCVGWILAGRGTQLRAVAKGAGTGASVAGLVLPWIRKITWIDWHKQERFTNFNKSFSVQLLSETECFCDNRLTPRESERKMIIKNQILHACLFRYL